MLQSGDPHVGTSYDPGWRPMVLELIPWLVAMAFLIGCSAFFSASEAALFSLRPVDRRSLLDGSTSERTAATLLNDPERLLSAVLFWNLVTNIAYFALASIVENRLPQNSPLVWPLRISSLLLIIFFSEMLPKTVAVLMSRQLSAACSLPLSVLIKLVDPLMTSLRVVMQASRRLLWPSFKSEEVLASADLERAIELSTTDAKLLKGEQTVLRNIVALSELRADESMRPANQLQRFCPPVAISDLEGARTRSGYLFLTEQDSENIANAVRLDSLWSIHPDHLEAAAEPVVYVPWCCSLADVTVQMLNGDREVAVVVNEWGESVGALTMDDIMDVVFTANTSRSQRLLKREPITQIKPELWQATGMTNLRRMAEYFRQELPETHNQTLGGIIQEELQRMPEQGDSCTWGKFHFEVLQSEPDGGFLVNIRRSAEDTEL